MPFSLELIILLAIALCNSFITSYLIGNNLRFGICATARAPSELYAKKTELNENQLWKLVIRLQKDGFQRIEATCRIRFVSDRNYEPPQGRIFVEDDYNGLIRVDDKGYAGIWTLSEDKNERKDGLWVWGLFEEPKFPFLYFYLDIYNSIYIENNQNNQEVPIFGGEGVPRGRLNIRFFHQRDPIKGSVLSGGQLTSRLTEFVKADPFGIGGKVDVGDTIEVGTVDNQEVNSST